MPTYDYLCENCEHSFEKFQSITARNLRKCPQCGKLKLKRLIGSGAGIIFKGTGFYETDYRSKSYTDAKQADKPKTESSDKKEAKSKDKTEAKPAVKETAKSESSGKSTLKGSKFPRAKP